MHVSLTFIKQGVEDPEILFLENYLISIVLLINLKVFDVKDSFYLVLIYSPYNKFGLLSFNDLFNDF